MDELYSDDFEKSIEEILHKIRRELEEARFEGRKNAYESSESNVEHQIIGPVLQALGWEITNPREVTTKSWKFSPEKPDFILYDSRHRRPSFVVEAKALGKISNPENVDQIFRYLQYSRYAILTDGIEWNLYSRRSRKGEPMWSFNFNRHNPKYCLLLLSGISKLDSSKFPNYSEKIQSHKYAASSLSSYFIDSSTERLVSKLDLLELVRGFLIPRIKRDVTSKNKHKLSSEEVKEYLEEDFNDVLMNTLAIKLRELVDRQSLS